MKKIIIFIVFAILILSSCAKKTPLQEFTGMKTEQATFIENILAEHNITYTKVAISSNPITNGMDEHWQAYDLIDEDNSSHVLILRKEDYDFTAVLDNEGRIIYGLIDNGIIPALI